MNKVVIITGASSGIGLATAQRLAKSGNKVYGLALNEFSDEAFECFRADVNDLDAIESIFETVKQKEGRIDVVINNAGFGIAGAIEYATPEMIQKIFDTNLTAVVKISSVAMKYLKETNGNLINISSVAGVLPIPFQACYSATKAAVLNFSLALDGEVRRFGVKVTAILPGDTKTGFTEARVVEGGEADYGGHIGKSIRRMEKDEQNGKSPDSVARVIEKTLKRRRPPLKVTVGAQYKVFVLLGKLLPTRFVNYILRKMYA
ncbi:MAG: SDR family NAD(P)-dependent oxidoreductase [Clostridiales bacterium]|nr:SDR family NAD(P)-dependent oxidoreductase [Clostridiales bacterium]